MKTPTLYRSIRESFVTHPNDWAAAEYTLTHKPSGLTLWIACGPADVNGYDDPAGNVRLGFVERWFVWFAYKRWLRVTTAMRLSKVGGAT